jgi:hypothetical protein
VPVPGGGSAAIKSELEEGGYREVGRLGPSAARPTRSSGLARRKIKENKNGPHGRLWAGIEK